MKRSVSRLHRSEKTCIRGEGVVFDFDLVLGRIMVNALEEMVIAIQFRHHQKKLTEKRQKNHNSYFRYVLFSFHTDNRS